MKDHRGLLQEQGSAVLFSLMMLLIGIVALPLTWWPTYQYHVLGHRCQMPLPPHSSFAEARILDK